MTIDTLRKLYEFNLFAMGKNLEGITHEESLVEAPAGGKCINWILGHIVAARNLILELVDEDPVWTDDEAAPYRRGSESLDVSKALPLSKMQADLRSSQQKLMTRLMEMPEEEWSKPLDNGTKLDRLAFLQFHEAYHIGQLGLLRRVVGKPGAIK
jgi:uncharacterized damage-inducible protein DinB